LDSSVEGDRDLLEAISIDSDLVGSELLFHPVGTEVGKVGTSGAQLIRPL
jgi:hypothetical protein